MNEAYVFMQALTAILVLVVFSIFLITIAVHLLVAIVKVIMGLFKQAPDARGNNP